MTILSSREHTCIQDSTRNKTELCNDLLDPVKVCYIPLAFILKTVLSSVLVSLVNFAKKMILHIDHTSYIKLKASILEKYDYFTA